MTNHMTDNPFEVRARERKAQAIADEIEKGWKLLNLWDRQEVGAAELASRIEGTARDVIASAAGQHAPSDITWTRVVEILEERTLVRATAPNRRRHA